MKKAVLKYIIDEHDRAGTDPVANARAIERTLAARAIENLFEGFVTLAAADSEKDETKMLSIIDQLCIALIDYRSTDRGCSILWRHADAQDEIPHPYLELLQILEEIGKIKSDTEKTSILQMCNEINLQEQTFYKWKKGDKVKIAEIVRTGYCLTPALSRIEGVISYAIMTLKRQAFNRMMRLSTGHS